MFSSSVIKPTVAAATSDAWLQSPVHSAVSADKNGVPFEEWLEK